MDVAVPTVRHRPVVVVTDDTRLADAAHRLAADAGVQLTSTGRSDPPPGIHGPPAAMLWGYDVDPVWAAALQRACPDTPFAVAGFGPLAAEDRGLPGCSHYSLPGDYAALVAWLERSTDPERLGLRVGIFGAHGGVGTSSLAVAVARLVVARGVGCTLVDLDPAGGPLRVLLGMDTVDAGWADLLAALATPDSAETDACHANDEGEAETDPAAAPDASHGAGHGARATRDTASPTTAELYLLAEARGIPPGVNAHRLREGIEAVEAARGATVTVFDASPGGPVPPGRLASWCDAVVVVARADAIGLAGIESLGRLLGTWCPVTLVWRVDRGRRTPGVPEALEGVRDFVLLGEETGIGEAGRHGVLPGDRTRGALAKSAAALVEMLGLAPAAKPMNTPDARLGQRTGPLPSLPQEIHWPEVPSDDAGPLERDVIALKLFAEPAAMPAEEPAGGLFVGAPPAPKGRRARRLRWAAKPQALKIGEWDERW
jgi:hypothetical protein